VLDFGCGSGLLTESLAKRGFDAVGYDPYSETHNDPAVLAEPFDVLIAQDVIEHSEDPAAMLREFDSLVKPGGRIVIGTPNASGITLDPIGAHIHPLHQPYHRHILSQDALATLTGELSWTQTSYFKTPYTNMFLLSLPFLHHLMNHFDGTIDVLFDRPSSVRFWLHPKTWFLFLAGRWRCDDADILAIYQKN
jgi:SAM-dependent methyltransferase